MTSQGLIPALQKDVTKRKDEDLPRLEGHRTALEGKLGTLQTQIDKILPIATGIANIKTDIIEEIQNRANQCNAPEQQGVQIGKFDITGYSEQCFDAAAGGAQSKVKPCFPYFASLIK